MHFLSENEKVHVRLDRGIAREWIKKRLHWHRREIVNLFQAEMTTTRDATSPILTSLVSEACQPLSSFVANFAATWPLSVAEEEEEDQIVHNKINHQKVPLGRTSSGTGGMLSSNFYLDMFNSIMITPNWAIYHHHHHHDLDALLVEGLLRVGHGRCQWNLKGNKWILFSSNNFKISNIPSRNVPENPSRMIGTHFPRCPN